MVLDWFFFPSPLQCGCTSLLVGINGFICCEWTGGGSWRSRGCRLKPGIDASWSLFYGAVQLSLLSQLISLTLPIVLGWSFFSFGAANFLFSGSISLKPHLRSFSHAAFFFSWKFHFSIKKNSFLPLYLSHKTVLIHSHECPSFMPWIHSSKTGVVLFHERFLHLPVDSTYMEKNKKPFSSMERASKHPCTAEPPSQRYSLFIHSL